MVAATNDGKWQSLTDEGKDSREATTIYTDDEAKKNNNKRDKKNKEANTEERYTKRRNYVYTVQNRPMKMSCLAG